MLELGDGNLLIADSNPGNDSANHHQILEYNPATQNLSQFANLTVPVGTSQYEDAGLLPQPSSLLLDADGNLLVGLAASQAGDGAVERFSIQTNPVTGDVTVFDRHDCHGISVPRPGLRGGNTVGYLVQHVCQQQR